MKRIRDLTLGEMYDRVVEYRKDRRRALVTYSQGISTATVKMILGEGTLLNAYKSGCARGVRLYQELLDREQGLLAPEKAHFKYTQQWATQDDYGMARSLFK